MPQQHELLLNILREFGLGPLHGVPLGQSGRASTPAPARQVAGINGLTIVVADLAAAGATLAALLGTTGRAADPVDLDEAGLAQVFELGHCRLLLIEPGDATDAERFLLAHGPGVYRIILGGSQRAAERASDDAASPISGDGPHETSWS